LVHTVKYSYISALFHQTFYPNGLSSFAFVQLFHFVLIVFYLFLNIFIRNIMYSKTKEIVSS
jgi:hypothetical protein